MVSRTDFLLAKRRNDTHLALQRIFVHYFLTYLPLQTLLGLVVSRDSLFRNSGYIGSLYYFLDRTFAIRYGSMLP